MFGRRFWLWRPSLRKRNTCTPLQTALLSMKSFARGPGSCSTACLENKPENEKEIEKEILIAFIKDDVCVCLCVLYVCMCCFSTRHTTYINTPPIYTYACIYAINKIIIYNCIIAKTKQNNGSSFTTNLHAVYNYYIHKLHSLIKQSSCKAVC